VCGVAFAAEDDFVPSISYKDGPTLVTREDGAGGVAVGVIRDAEGNDISYVYEEDCLVVTTIAQALRDIETGIPNEAELLLEEVYRGILGGTMDMPFENSDDLAIIQMMDATFLCNGAADGEDHEKLLETEGVRMELIFDLGVGAGVPVSVMCYVDGKWIEVETVNNGDGTVTCLFEKTCPIVFAVPTNAVETPPTGDNSTAELGLWIGLLIASSVAMTCLVIFRRKIVR
jgi:hypothetical protein